MQASLEFSIQIILFLMKKVVLLGIIKITFVIIYNLCFVAILMKVHCFLENKEKKSNPISGKNKKKNFKNVTAEINCYPEC